MPKILNETDPKLATLSLDELVALRPNKLKEGGDISYIKESIKELGFKIPFFVSQGMILDGDHRVEALVELRDEGYEIDRLGYVDIPTESVREAKQVVLALNGQAGHASIRSITAFTEGLDLGFINKISNIPELTLLSPPSGMYESVEPEKKISAPSVDPGITYEEELPAQRPPQQSKDTKLYNGPEKDRVVLFFGDGEKDLFEYKVGQAKKSYHFENEAELFMILLNKYID